MCSVLSRAYGRPAAFRVNHSGWALYISSPAPFESIRANTTIPSCRATSQQLAEEIAIAEKLGPAVKWNLCRIIRNDAARVDDDALGVGALPLFAPPGDVVAGHVDFGDVRLHPADGAAEPGLRGGSLLRRMRAEAGSEIIVSDAAAAVSSKNSRRDRSESMRRIIQRRPLTRG